MYEFLLLYPSSIAFSNDRMVSRGRSRRGRVGFDRSGSAVKTMSARCPPKEGLTAALTNDIAICIFVLTLTKALHSRLLGCGHDYRKCAVST